MHGMAAQSGVILLELQLLGLELFVARGGVARGRLSLFSRFGAFDRDNFPGHKFIPFLWASLPALLPRIRLRSCRPRRRSRGHPVDAGAVRPLFRAEPEPVL